MVDKMKDKTNQLLDMNKELSEYIELQRTGLITTTALLIVSLIINVVQFYK